MAILYVAHLVDLDESEELLLLEAFQGPDDGRHFGIIDGAPVLLAPLSDVVEKQHGTRSPHVLAVDGREAVCRLGARALVVADAEESLVDEPYDRREHAVAIEVVPLQIVAHTPPQLWKRFSELDHAAELFLFPLRAKARVVEVLSTAFLVDPEGLQRRGIASRDPNFAPRGRNTQATNAGEGPLIGDREAVGLEIGEPALFAPFTADTVEIDVPPPPNRLSGHVYGSFCENGAAWCATGGARSNALPNR